jgi:hypothetical protein
MEGKDIYNVTQTLTQEKVKNEIINKFNDD